MIKDQDRFPDDDTQDTFIDTRPLSDQPKAKESLRLLTPLYTLAKTNEALNDLISRIFYSPRYSDDHFEYRHVIMPKKMYESYVPKEFKGLLLTDAQWRSLGIQQSPGWFHYMLHKPEPHIFLFKRAKTPGPPPEIADKTILKKDPKRVSYSKSNNDVTEDDGDILNSKRDLIEAFADEESSNKENQAAVSQREKQSKKQKRHIIDLTGIES